MKKSASFACPKALAAVFLAMAAVPAGALAQERAPQLDGIDAYVAQAVRDLRAKEDQKRQQEDAKRVAGTQPSLPLQKYAGRYADPLYGQVDVALRDGKLILTMGPGLVAELEHWHYDTFAVPWKASWRGRAMAVFSLDASGEPSQLQIGSAQFHRADKP